MTDQHVYILLGAFEGSRHIQRQLDSICAQTHTNWTLLVRDDGSRDHTIEIVNRVSNRDDRVEIVSDDAHVGCATNFSRLGIEACRRGAAYAMFSDQDDVWFPTKVEKTLERMLEAEERTGPAHPILVHTDLELIDPHGMRVHPSFMKFQRIGHMSKRPLKTLFVQNFVTGCTAMANRPLLELALPIPHQALMHDWWFALCAASTGTVTFLPEATVSYRRHGRNTVTVRGFWRTVNPLRTDWRRLWSEGASNHGRAVVQAGALLLRLSNAGISMGESTTMIRAFIAIHDVHSNVMVRLVRAIRLGLSSQTWPRKIMLYMRLLWWPQLADSTSASLAAKDVAPR